MLCDIHRERRRVTSSIWCVVCSASRRSLLLLWAAFRFSRLKSRWREAVAPWLVAPTSRWPYRCMCGRTFHRQPTDQEAIGIATRPPSRDRTRALPAPVRPWPVTKGTGTYTGVHWDGLGIPLPFQAPLPGIAMAQRANSSLGGSMSGPVQFYHVSSPLRKHRPLRTPTRLLMARPLPNIQPSYNRRAAYGRRRA